MSPIAAEMQGYTNPWGVPWTSGIVLIENLLIQSIMELFLYRFIVYAITWYQNLLFFISFFGGEGTPKID